MAPEFSSTVTVATYNVLAEAHIRPEWFPLVDPAHFVTATRYPRVVKRVVGLDADILCLQEVDDKLFGLLEAALSPLGYSGLHTKYDDKPDGLATFLRSPLTDAYLCALLHFDDAAFNQGKPSGRKAHIIRTQIDKKSFAIANTHLKWDVPNTPREERLGLQQEWQLIDFLSGAKEECIVCGDFNVMPNDALLDDFHNAGYVDAHPSATMTFNSSDAVGGARKIDYILHSQGLVADPLSTPEVNDDTPLPSDTEPSDHLPLVAKFTFVD